jgi:hypothetical protein
MKKLILTSVLAVMVALGTTVMAQENPAEYLGLPGDNLNLYAVMKLFQESQTLESFERSLNDENSRINNLDLNGDNMIDYLTVSDYADGDVHTIVLRAMLSKNESQDVAVFTVQRFNNGSVQIQLIGDEALYGKNYIIEPIYDDNNGETPNPGYMGRQANQVNISVVRTTPYEIAAWPLVRFIYLPGYVTWQSSWYFGFYPSFWHPWRPFYWNYYYGYQHNFYNDYYAHYRRWDHYRYPRYNDFYYSGLRKHSTQVGERIHDGRYKDTYSHPEQRREGEALYSRMHPGQETRRPDNREMNNQGGRSASQSNRERSSEGNNSRNQRQPGNSVSNRSRNSRTSDQNGNVSRTPSASPNRSVNRTDQTQRSVSRPEQTQRSVSRPEQTQRSVSRPEQTQRSSSRPERTQRSETARSSRQSAPREKSSASRSSRESKATSSGKSSGKAKESKSDKGSRRK